MSNLFEILGMSERTENTIKELNFDKFKKQNYELYKLIQENIINYKEQYNLFCNTVNLDISNAIYRNYLELKNTKSEYVYFIKNDSTGLVKIGMTTDPHQRLLAIKTTLNTATGVNNKLRYIGIIRMTSTNMQDFENSLHKKYALYRKNGEWFDLSEEHILNTYFSKSYRVHGVPFQIEIDNRNINNYDTVVPDTIWGYLVIHKIMKICGKKYSNICINNPYLNMYLFYLKNGCLDSESVFSVENSDVIEQIIRKAMCDI